jgi:hypothetical protein
MTKGKCVRQVNMKEDVRTEPNKPGKIVVKYTKIGRKWTE